jgi:hypothetical protein
LLVNSRAAALQQVLEAEFVSPPLLGLNNINMLESSNVTFQVTSFGTEANNCMMVGYRG